MKPFLSKFQCKITAFYAHTEIVLKKYRVFSLYLFTLLYKYNKLFLILGIYQDILSSESTRFCLIF